MSNIEISDELRQYRRIFLSCAEDDSQWQDGKIPQAVKEALFDKNGWSMDGDVFVLSALKPYQIVQTYKAKTDKGWIIERGYTSKIVMNMLDDLLELESIWPEEKSKKSANETFVTLLSSDLKAMRPVMKDISPFIFRHLTEKGLTSTTDSTAVKESAKIFSEDAMRELLEPGSFEANNEMRLVRKQFEKQGYTLANSHTLSFSQKIKNKNKNETLRTLFDFHAKRVREIYETDGGVGYETKSFNERETAEINSAADIITKIGGDNCGYGSKKPARLLTITPKKPD